MRKFLDKWFKKTTIIREDKILYLTRYYIYRKHFWWLPSIYIHCFHSGDKDMELHDHPWLNSISIILKGSYKEEYRVGNDVKTRILFPGSFNLVGKNKFHRIDLISNEVWTLFISGPKTNSWGFWDRNTGIYKDFKVFLKEKGLT